MWTFSPASLCDHTSNPGFLGQKFWKAWVNKGNFRKDWARDLARAEKPIAPKTIDCVKS